ncbi:MAG: SPOR domain-containing protein [Candidatus Andeanibacterium colombiense]|uniref:SPOR domain-containing protein n=1 Tax=Candidatus Andeanibacterium colombiense TaxID=3121345 RepID=A0AAJ5X423_9SPHN|nr:MAG: SPOR domain-containing protein [Sphingomonadaceae bacterium]
MKRTDKSTIARDTRLIGLALTTALAGATLTGCAASAPLASTSASKAETALAHGNHTSAIEHAEAAVQAEPRNASYRATLGAAYLDAGRFASAATSFNDAMKLGDNSPRTALSLALALSADGKGNDAQALLADWHDDIAPADLGLAYSLAGNPGKGIQILFNSIRNGDNTAKARQNLAFSYALNGQWREARLMAEQDLGKEKVGDRMAEWSTEVDPAGYRERVAGLLKVAPNAADPGQPVQLALANSAGAEQLAAEASATAAPAAPQPTPTETAFAAAAGEELAPIGDAPQAGFAAAAYQAPEVPRGDSFQTAFTPPPSSAALAAVSMDARAFAAPAPRGTPAKRVTSGFVADAGGAGHLVQLGSFASEQGARRAWGIYVKRYPELADHDMVLTEAMVKGKRYWRVSAGGYSMASSRAMCGRIDSRHGDGCFAYAESRPMAGAVLGDQRMALK